MSKFDIHHGIKIKPAFNIQLISTDTTTNGLIIDTLGYESVEFSLQSGVIATGTFTPFLEESDNLNMEGATLVDSTFVLDSYSEAVFGASSDNLSKSIGYVGKKRYVRLSIVTASTANGTIGSVVILYNALHNPTQGTVLPTG